MTYLLFYFVLNCLKKLLTAVNLFHYSLSREIVVVSCP